MDIGDIGSLIFFAIIALSFLGRFFGGRGDEGGRRSRPADLSETGGHDPSLPQRVEHQPMVTHTPDEPLVVEAGSAEARTRDRRSSGRERPGDRVSDAASLRNIRAARDEARERYATATAVVGVDVDRGSSATRSLKRRRRIVEGGDVLRRSLKDPAALERGFIVKEVLDLPVGLRRDA